ncbi:DUF2807 domain-containing protein [Sphingomonas sp. 2R-10]|uniref:GIN domain-containing protein n=1 Tax=Sphingomonas sp. 2R-10 TaxID=3045148 RepID=UPI000F782E2F|nr:DUF2807 domain-containing protein [Sphingomonas sp. 2R-10]MDJ0275334.1 DUF2807 domain-containing protein [Sphingomonas sp. 2R-10]
MRWMILATLGLAACGADRSNDGDRRGDARPAALRDFTAVALESSDQVEITRGTGFAVRIEADPAVRDRLDIRRDGDTLRIGRKDGGSWTGGDGVARIRVSMPEITAAALAGSGDITIDQASDGFAGTLGGSGDMTIGQLRGERAALTVAGTGTIAAAGSVRQLALSTAGSGDIDARQVRAGAATVSIAGSGGVAADIDGPVQVTLVGSGSATLGANARCTVNRVGTGDVTCGRDDRTG